MMERSDPDHQWSDQVKHERKRLGKEYAKGKCHYDEDERNDLAHMNIEKRWREQGIWREEWFIPGYFWGPWQPDGVWKHQEPLEEPESESESVPDSPPGEAHGSSGGQPGGGRRRRPKSDEERFFIAERRLVREREREASRPDRQFAYQVAKEEEMLRERIKDGEVTGDFDVGVLAYRKVKHRWLDRGIWDREWGPQPGKRWKHERPHMEHCFDGRSEYQSSPDVADVGGSVVERPDPVVERTEHVMQHSARDPRAPWEKSRIGVEGMQAYYREVGLDENGNGAWSAQLYTPVLAPLQRSRQLIDNQRSRVLSRGASALHRISICRPVIGGGGGGGDRGKSSGGPIAPVRRASKSLQPPSTHGGVTDHEADRGEDTISPRARRRSDGTACPAFTDRRRSFAQRLESRGRCRPGLTPERTHRGETDRDVGPQDRPDGFGRRRRRAYAAAAAAVEGKKAS